MPEKLKGTIKEVLVAEGFGFIAHPGSADDYFFHKSSVDGGVGFKDLREDMAVEFLPVTAPKGPRAIDVRAV